LDVEPEVAFREGKKRKVNMERIMKTKLAITAAACVLAACQVANATLTISGSVGGAPTGVNKVNFDDLTLGAVGGTASGPNGSVGVSFVIDGQAVVGAVSGQFAEPYLSGGNGNGFGPANANQANGTDLTTYLTSGGANGQAILSFGANEMYMGLLWGSVDTYNTLSFYNGTTLVGTVTGSQVFAIPTGDQGQLGTSYVNINSTLAFNKVVATSSVYAFEFDNVAYNPTAVVPEPTTMVAGALLLLPFGASTLRILRRRTA
jgi:hypothetical protein